jgi:hypothetical protein
MRFEAIYEYRESSRLPVEETAEMLGIDEYTFRHEYELYEVEELERSIDSARANILRPVLPRWIRSWSSWNYIRGT